MSEDLIEEIDWKGNVVAVHPKSFMKEMMFPHKVSLIIPRDKNGNFILSKRAIDKLPMPNTWVCAVGGKVEINETYEEAAIREMKEEADINAELEPVTKVKYNHDDYKAIFQIFTTKKPIDINSLKPDFKEVQYFESFSKKEIEKNIHKNPESFAPTFRVAVKEFLKKI